MAQRVDPSSAQQVEGSGPRKQQFHGSNNRLCTPEENLQWMDFAMFVKLVGKYLSQKDPALRNQVKELIHTTTEEYNGAYPQKRSLRDELESRIRSFVGEKHWKKCELYMSAYLESHNKRNKEVIPDNVYDWEGLFDPETEAKISADMEESNQS